MKAFALSAALGAAALCEAAYNTVAVDTRSLEDIYAAARKEEGTLQVFWGGDAGSQGDSVRQAWADRFPDVKLNLTVDLSKYHDNRIDRAHLEGLHVADVAVLQTLHDFRRWKNEGKLLDYKPATFEDILPGEKDADGAWFSVRISSFGTFLYDTTKLNASDVPSSYAELTDKKYKGKLVITYPNDDDAIAYLFSLIVSRYGFQWLYDLAENDVQWVRGTGSPSAILSASHNTTSTRALSFTSYNSGASFFATQAPEAPEQIMSWAQSAAIIASTPRPESAKLFLSYLTSFEQQNATAASGRPSILTNLNEQYGVSPDSNITQVSGFRVFEQDRNTVEWWKNLFEEVLGSAQGKGPLEVYPNP
ncbi:hypothetical protein CKM354_000753500 [Cercospora kikuchii]|uniref:Periplasmic binding protein-like II n=1 Tax=Cercospora kikuchii TaxID=84275 RepID=A0A9P3CH74_9PEZI|nr:uncharacterized protein CKM354_000753500 [Cercospora kikuchii]GIZ44334.1 hypothetical protein CKM354_000753500 [Cercospora kikuchii]